MILNNYKKRIYSHNLLFIAFCALVEVKGMDTKMSNKILYLDESGKTGTQRYLEKWNFEEQPYFALCGILINEGDLSELNQFVDSLRKLYRIQGEIKSTKDAVSKNRECIVEQIWDKQREFGCKIYIEIVNKRFCMAMKINDYCVLPYYDISTEYYSSYEGILIRKNFANYICKTINDELLGEFVEFFDNDTKDIMKMKSLCKKLMQNISHDALIDNIKETLDSIDNYEKLGLLQRHIFPLVDYYKGKSSSVAICPHVDSFNNILNRTEGIDNLLIIHDKLADLGDALKQIVAERSTKDSLRTIQFEDSKKNNLLQLSDFWCGIINNTVQKILAGEKNRNSIIDKILQTKVNFVSTFEEQEILFPNNVELKMWNIWYRDYFEKNI